MDENNSSENVRNLENTEQNLAPLIDNTMNQPVIKEEKTEEVAKKPPIILVLSLVLVLILIIVFILLSRK